MYESPQARQLAYDVRRRIAIALHSLGDEINPRANSQQPRFNRPEDAEGFYQSRAGADPGVEADEESRRRQREELMYWNAVAMEKKEKERMMNASQDQSNSEQEKESPKSPASRFEDFLQEHPVEKGTYVYNTGSDVRRTVDEGLIHRRGGVEGLRGLGASIYSNPFADEYHIDAEEQRTLMEPEESEKIEIMSDIYNASEKEYPKAKAVPEEQPKTLVKEQQPEPLVDISDTVAPAPEPVAVSLPVFEDTNFTNMQEPENAYAAIHAWADNTNANASFYSPLPTTPQNEKESSFETMDYASAPRSPISSAAFNSDDEEGNGEATPTDTISLAGSGEDVGAEIWGPRSGATSEIDIMSVDEESIDTPNTWSEVGSVVSGDELGSHH